MIIRKATIADNQAITQLFYETITSINVKDYDAQQIETWASSAENKDFWQEQIEKQHFIIVENDEYLLGFASLTTDGYLDFMYVHKNHQKQGIAGALLENILNEANRLNLTKIWTDASITARPFFLNKGFVIEKIYTKISKEVAFENAIMVRNLK
ncbi:acetyltransferase [Emticicia aquatilis]|uniref:Acetyltransferase n=1 Tax=Emticicia aquatilis TaxID=1537369 RepID=A0A916YG13_9BACT|nr:GNAT family N-acetyltransferase [Emticicia aquatilis]GGD43250.1 acetyltransferase [Emticicia aquatilis]